MSTPFTHPAVESGSIPAHVGILAMAGEDKTKAGAILRRGRAPQVAVNPKITSAKRVVVVKKPHTAPARVEITLSTSDKKFPRGGTLELVTTATSGSIKFFDAKSEGNDITPSGTGRKITAGELKAGFKLFAQADKPSTNADDVTLKLTLDPGPTAVGNPAELKLTAVQLTLDISPPRASVADAFKPLPEPTTATAPPAATDKWFGGVVVNAQDPDSNQPRAQLVVQQVLPLDFTDELILQQIRIVNDKMGAVANQALLFDDEIPGAKRTPKVKEKAKSNPFFIKAKTITSASGQQFFIEGKTGSSALREVGYQLGIRNVENDGDRVAFAVAVAPVIKVDSKIVVVKKPHTNPARRKISLSTSAAFSRKGTLTRSATGAIKIFDKKKDGTEIDLTGAGHEFTSDELKKGVDIFAEATTASGAADDYTLTLTLEAGVSPVGAPSTLSMTAVEFTLDVTVTRTDPATAPATLPQPPTANNKFDLGRFVQVKDPGFSHERATLIVRRPNPVVAVTLTLTRSNSTVQAFNEENPAAGQKTVDDKPVNIVSGTIPATGTLFFVEGAKPSSKVRDTGYRLGIQGLENECDRLTMTAVQIDVTQKPKASEPAIRFVRFGIWDKAYDAAGAVINNVDEDKNLVGADKRKFHFRVKDPNATGNLSVDWKTLLADGTTDDDAPPTSKVLTLPASSAGSKTFISRAVMLVTDDTDRDFAPDSGLSAPLDTGARNFDQSNHRTRRAKLDGFVKAEYSPATNIQLRLVLPTFNRKPDERKRLSVSVIRYTNAANPVFATATAAYITGQFDHANQRWNQIGLQIDAGATTDRPIPAAALDATGVYGGSIDNPNEQAALNDLIPITADNTLTVVFVPLSGANAYTTIGQRAAVALADRYFIFIDTTLSLQDETLAHEFAHALFNRFDTGVARQFFTLNTNSPTALVTGTGIALPDVRIYRRIQNLNSPNPDNDPSNNNILNWARRRRTARFPIAPGVAVATATTGNKLVQNF